MVKVPGKGKGAMYYIATTLHFGKKVREGSKSCGQKTSECDGQGKIKEEKNGKGGRG